MVRQPVFERNDLMVMWNALNAYAREVGHETDDGGIIASIRITQQKLEIALKHLSEMQQEDDRYATRFARVQGKVQQ